MKGKYIAAIFGILFFISLLINVKLVYDRKSSDKIREDAVMYEINGLTGDVEELLRAFIAKDELRERKLVSASYMIRALQRIINTEQYLAYVSHTSAVADFRFIGASLVMGGDIGGHKMGGVYLDNEIAESELAYLKFLADGLRDTYGAETYEEYGEM